MIEPREGAISRLVVCRQCTCRQWGFARVGENGHEAQRGAISIHRRRETMLTSAATIKRTLRRGCWVRGHQVKDKRDRRAKGNEEVTGVSEGTQVKMWCGRLVFGP